MTAERTKAVSVPSATFGAEEHHETPPDLFTWSHHQEKNEEFLKHKRKTKLIEQLWTEKLEMGYTEWYYEKQRKKKFFWAKKNKDEEWARIFASNYNI